MKEFGNEVEDFREIDPIFGTMEDFDNLLSSIQDRGSYCFFVCALQDVIRIWLEKGVDGFQMDVVKFILEAEHLRRASDADVSWLPYSGERHQTVHMGTSSVPRFNQENITSHSELYHDYTDSQVGLHVILQGWHQVMDEYSTEPGRYRLKPTTTKYINVINMLLLTLPGTPTSYYGEEIGMENIAVSEDHIQDLFGKYDPVSVR
ncbi:Neutral and basic amino acid transport protein rBAT [Acipenser ruthenus]|uniref:Neutral and basic amino acid transport protein rBAT n=1 Tax=Acipenser ruthenus TaxID=7906 RepID=A0A662YRP0_ACIRT|nr:Neutral and basic amino acid transport protein rBAT [Acipenser ruthenus]